MGKQLDTDTIKKVSALMFICVVLLISSVVVMMTTIKEPVPEVDYTGLEVNIGVIDSKGISADRETFYFTMIGGDVVKVSQHDYILWTSGDTYRYFIVDVVQGAE